ncbi:MAG: DNA mismatch repair protein MutH [Succinivibrio sp.]
MKRNEGWHAAPPLDYAALTASLESIKGRTIADLAAAAGVPLPLGPLHGKGFQGELVERFLGASAPGLPIPDFPNLGCELKTLPLDERFRPLESTFICSAPLDPSAPSRFEDSILFHKISRVLFVFLIAPRSYSYQQRFVAGYRFWKPDERQMAAIRRDYEELMELAKTGGADAITARDGTVVQMRPKAADGSALTKVAGPDGQMVLTRPRGFYMRRSFTEGLLRSFGILKG